MPLGRRSPPRRPPRQADHRLDRAGGETPCDHGTDRNDGPNVATTAAPPTTEPSTTTPTTQPSTTTPTTEPTAPHHLQFHPGGLDHRWVVLVLLIILAVVLLVRSRSRRRALEAWRQEAKPVLTQATLVRDRLVGPQPQDPAGPRRHHRAAPERHREPRGSPTPLRVMKPRPGPM